MLTLKSCDSYDYRKETENFDPLSETWEQICEAHWDRMSKPLGGLGALEKTIARIVKRIASFFIWIPPISYGWIAINTIPWFCHYVNKSAPVRPHSVRKGVSKNRPDNAHAYRGGLTKSAAKSSFFKEI